MAITRDETTHNSTNRNRSDLVAVLLALGNDFARYEKQETGFAINMATTRDEDKSCTANSS